MAALAEVRVVGIAEGEDGEVDGFERRRVRSVERGVERGGVVRWFAIAVGGGDDDEVLQLCEIRRRDLRHVAEGGGMASWRRGSC